MEELPVVDGSNLLFQMFCGLPARILNHQGRVIRGVLGLTNTQALRAAGTRE